MGIGCGAACSGSGGWNVSPAGPGVWASVITVSGSSGVILVNFSILSSQSCRDVVELVGSNLRLAEIEIRKAFIKILDDALACLVNLHRAVASVGRRSEIVLLGLALHDDFDFDVLPERFACCVAERLTRFLLSSHASSSVAPPEC
jgi:hypothetical protein